MAKTLKDFLESYDFNRAAIAKQRLQNLRHQGRKVRGARIANLMRAAGLKEEELDETDLDQLDEVLSADAKASDWIHDFVHSTNPKFEGKSKKERIRMALGAYYSKARHKDGEGLGEEVEQVDEGLGSAISSVFQKMKAKLTPSTQPSSAPAKPARLVAGKPAVKKMPAKPAIKPGHFGYHGDTGKAFRSQSERDSFFKSKNLADPRKKAAPVVTKEEFELDEAFIAPALSAANAAVEHGRRPSPYKSSIVVHHSKVGGSTEAKDIKAHLKKHGVDAHIGTNDNYRTVHIHSMSHSAGDLKKKLGLNEAVKTTHEDPLVTVHDKHGLHTHANLSTANHIFGTNVKHTDVHAGPVKTKDGHETKRDLTFAISKHHEIEMKESKDYEYADGDMSITQLKQIKAHSEWILEMLKPDTDMPEWVQSKITLAADYLSTACDYLHVELNEGAQYAGLEKEDKPGKIKTAVVKTHKNAVGSETVEGWKDAKKPVKEQYDEDGNIVYEKKSFQQFVEAMTATQVRPGVTRYTGGSYGSAKGAKYGNTDYDNEDLEKKDDEGQEQQKRGRGRPAGAKSGARGPRIK